MWKFCHLTACGYNFRSGHKTSANDRYNPNLFRRWCELYLFEEHNMRGEDEWQDLIVKFETDPEDPF
jgi:hypothetical protein